MSGTPLPSKSPEGPFFIDTASCQCAFQPTRQIKVDKGRPRGIWRCIGSGSDDVYVGDTGKWFFPVNNVPASSKDLHEPINWAGNPPKSGSPYVVANDTDAQHFRPLDDTNGKSLSLVDNVCTAENSTEQSTEYYKMIEDGEAGQPGAELGICLSPESQPIPIQNASSWNTQGCNLGFHCRCTR